jgi:hypothetical protein
VSRAFPSYTRSILAEIYLCHPCSCHKIEDGNARTDWADPANSTTIVQMLLNANADPNRRVNDGCYPAILWAATCNDLDLVALLLAHHADPTLTEVDGISAMTEATSGNDGQRNLHLLELLQGGAAVREHFVRTGRVEWPIPAPPPPPAPPAAAYTAALQPRPDFTARMMRIRDECLRISVEEGQPPRPTDRASVSRAFPSWKRSILTEIYLCHACS